MPWGNFPLIGIILGLAGGFLQFYLLTRLSLALKSRRFVIIGIIFAKLAVYALLLLAAFKLSIYDGAACGILMALSLVILSLYKSFRGGKKNER